MKPTQIPHPLKRICLTYNSEAALSNFEKNFIERYKLLHDELVVIKNQLVQLGPDIEMVMTGLAEVKNSFDTLDNKITSTELMLGIGDDGLVPGHFVVRPGEIQNLLDEFQSVRKDYWLIMVPMHNLFNNVYRRFIAFDDTVEQFEKEFSEPLFQNFETIEIDIASFDKDMNRFRDAWMAIASMQDKCLDEYNEWAKRQTSLVNDSDDLYDRIKNLFQHISQAQTDETWQKASECGLN